MEHEPAGTPRSPGRKRDPRIEAAVLTAAIEVYAVHGWHGFGFDVVARAAGIGKSAIYLRTPATPSFRAC